MPVVGSQLTRAGGQHTHGHNAATFTWSRCALGCTVDRTLQERSAIPPSSPLHALHWVRFSVGR